MGEHMWEQLFDELTSQKDDKQPIPVRRVERVDRMAGPDQRPPRLDGRPSMELSRMRSEKSLRSTRGTIRSFHRPFYAEDPPWLPRSRSNTASSVSVDPVPARSLNPSLHDSPSFSPRTDNNSSTESLETPITPDGSSAYSAPHPPDRLPHNECELHHYSYDVHVVSPDELTECFNAVPKIPSRATASTDDCPDRATLAAVQDIPIYDSHGRSMPFGALYDPAHSPVHPRQLLIFIRHFHCGACQAYVRALTQRISLQEYFAIPVPTSFAVIGCGRPAMIRYYRKLTGCPWPIYADPTRRLFRKLGMAPTLRMGGAQPEYMRGVGVAGMWTSSLGRVAKGYVDDEHHLGGFDAVKGGNIFQIGGEFLFEEGQVVWCHRMKNWLGHAEVGEVRKLLELDL